MIDQAATRKKTNSPRAPGIGLRQAVGEVSRAYDRYGHGSFTRGELASALEMSGNSGAFLTKIAALRDYGLIEGAGDELRVSGLFRSIYQASSGDSSGLPTAALSAVLSSSVFDKLLQQFSTKVPDESSIALRLETQERFNRDRAKVVAAAFRSSLQDYGLIDNVGNLIRPRSGAGERGEPERSEPVQDDVKGASDRSTVRVEVPLREGRIATIVLPIDVDKNDVKKISAVLTAYASDS